MRYKVLTILCVLIILNWMTIGNALAASASCYGMKYQNGDDTHDTMQKAFDSLGSIGYTRNQYYDQYSVSTDNVLPQDVLNRMNSDNVFYFSGHGYEGKMVFVTSQNNMNGITAQGSGNTLNSLSYTNIHDIAFAMFQSCLSANTNTANGYGNLQYELDNRGVDSSIGWNAIIYYPQTVCWNDGFWNMAISGSYSISACGHNGDARVVQYFGSDLGGTQGWCMKGDRTQTLNPAQTGD